jgi:SAM-dependent methyltransferase
VSTSMQDSAIQDRPLHLGEEIAPRRGARHRRDLSQGLGISESFVQMASEYAKKESVKVHFIHGSAADIPLEEGFFDLVVCRAAFKNFTGPLKALNEMHRVMKPGGRAVVIDLRKDASWDEIVSYVDQLGLRRMSSWMTKIVFKHTLLKRAYTVKQMESLAAASDFKSSEIIRNPVGMEIRLYKPPNATEERLREDKNEAVKLGLDMERGEARLVT